jgi:hypothetical protein
MENGFVGRTEKEIKAKELNLIKENQKQIFGLRVCNTF